MIKTLFHRGSVREKVEKSQIIAGYLKNTKDPGCPQGSWITLIAVLQPP